MLGGRNRREERMHVAWIGLGHMGLPTAKTVAKAGHRVTAYDVKPPSADTAEPLVLKSSAREAAAGAEVVCIAVFSDDQVEEVLMGPEGLFEVLRPGTVVAMFTTGTIASARKLAAAAPAGVSVLDTCFSRNNAMLKAGGALNILVGGDPDALERCRPALEPFARAIFHMGPSGAGRAIKLVNNLCWAAHNHISVEALKLAEGLGLDPYAALKVILQSSGANDTQNVYLEDGWQKTFEFMRPYLHKDASAAAEAAREAHVELHVLQAAIEACTSSAEGGQP
jgi:3-hydroxyisobutyrate dehydrogenase-like beta-hydroxyacid dehydrogenase